MKQFCKLSFANEQAGLLHYLHLRDGLDIDPALTKNKNCILVFHAIEKFEYRSAFLTCDRLCLLQIVCKKNTCR